jgi:ABC-type nitrate/sulfonate/bicarbonate transport system permease component
VTSPLRTAGVGTAAGAGPVAAADAAAAARAGAVTAGSAVTASGGDAAADGSAPLGGARRRRRRFWLRLRRGLGPAAILVLVVVGWQLATTVGHVDPAVLPGPRLVATATWDDRADLWPAVTTTTTEAVLGLLVAAAVGVAAAVAIDASRAVRGGLFPLLVVSQTLPIVALAPMVVIWFGFGTGPKIGLVGLFSFFPITVGLVQGLGEADPDAVALLRTLRASRRQQLRLVRLPGALPQLFTGLRISATYAYTSAIVAELFGAQQGIGVYLDAAAHDAPAETDLVLGAALVTAALTVGLYLVVGALQRLAMPWQHRDPS